PSLCADQASANYRTDNNMAGEAGKHAGNGGSSADDGGASGGGGGGMLGGKGDAAVVFVEEWTGRGGHVGLSGAASGVTTASLSSSTATRPASEGGYALIRQGGGVIDINGTVHGPHTLTVSPPRSSVDISGAI